MHLIDLIAELEAVKVARGNVKLVDVVVMAAGDQRPIVDCADRPARGRDPQLVIDVSGMGEDQIEEIRAENPSAQLFSAQPDHSAKPSEPCSTMGCEMGTVGHAGDCGPEPERELVQCNLVDVTRGRCMLTIGHDEEHVWEYPERKPAPAPLEMVGKHTVEGAGEVRGATDGAKNVLVNDAINHADAPCATVNLRDEPCRLSMGHDGDHDFRSPKGSDGAEVVDRKEPDAADLAQAMEDAAAKLPETTDDRDAPRCNTWLDGKRCALGIGHEDSHVYIQSIALHEPAVHQPEERDQ